MREIERGREREGIERSNVLGAFEIRDKEGRILDEEADRGDK